MAKRKKPSLKKAFEELDKLPESFFGSVDVDISTLPCLTKPKKVKITANFDEDVLERIKAFAEENNASYANVMNDVLRKVFIDDKQAG